jgi:GntR family transcriptional regulator, transcriptional repressor for pyruvate dehydrogenase complex
MSALSSAIYSATDNTAFVDDSVQRATLRAHNSVTEAIRMSDSQIAIRRMSKHVHSYAQAIAEVEERTEIRLGRG